MTIDAYLAELERLLPWSARRRALAEVKEHLRDTAARHRAAGASEYEAETASTTAFGSPDDVARRILEEIALRGTRLASLLALCAVLAFVFPLYVIPENSLAPATWPKVPQEIVALQRAAIGLWLLASGLAVTCALVAWSRRPGSAAVFLVATSAAIGAAAAVGSALALRWIALSPTTPNWALSGAVAVPMVAACVVAAAWTYRRRGALRVT